MTTEMTGAVGGNAALLKTVYVDADGKIVVGPGGSGLDATRVQGATASDFPDVGNPVKIGAVFNVNPPSVGAGDVVNAQANTYGTLRTMPGFMTVAILSDVTAAVGTNWTTFASTACSMIDIANVTGTDIEYRRDGAGSGMRIPDGGSRLVLGISNSNQISFRRVDTSNTQVTVTAEVMA